MPKLAGDKVETRLPTFSPIFSSLRLAVYPIWSHMTTNSCLLASSSSWLTSSDDIEVLLGEWCIVLTRLQVTMIMREFSRNKER